MRSEGETTDQLGRGRIEVIDVGYRDATASIDRDMTNRPQRFTGVKMIIV